MNRLKNNINIEKIKEIALKFGLNDISNLILSLEHIQKENEYIDIAVVGRFKSGKTSLINSLISKDILPVGILPVTTVPSFILDGKQELNVVFKNGEKRKIEIKELENYISQEKNPDNKLEISYTEIKIPLGEKFKNIRLIDTPGLSYSFVHNKLTKELFPSLNVIIFCFSFDLLPGEEEINILNDLKKYTDEIVFVITKTDLISQNELEKLIEFLKKKGIERVFPFSIKNPKLIEEFKEKIIFQYCEKHKEIKQKTLLYKYTKIKQYLIDYLNAIELTINKKKEEKEKFINFLNHNKERLFEFQKQLKNIAFRIKEENRENILKIFFDCQENSERKIINAIKTKISENSVSLRNISKIYEQELEKLIEGEMIEILKNKKREIIQILSKSMENILELSNDFLSSMYSKSKEVLGVDFPLIKIEIPDLKIRLGEIRFIKAFDIHIDLLFPVIPFKIFKNLIIKRLIKKSSFEIEKSLTKTAMEISQYINQEVDNVVEKIIEELKLRIYSLENAIKLDEDKQKEIENSLKELSAIS